MGKVYATHDIDYQFDSKINGYTTHTFNNNYNSLTTDFISSNDDSVVYSFTINKGQFKKN